MAKSVVKPIKNQEIIKYLCQQCDDDELKYVLKNVMKKTWVK